MSRTSGTFRHVRTSRSRATSTATTARAGRSGGPSTGSPTAVRCTARSARRGRSRAARRPASTRGDWRRSGSTRCSSEARAGTLPGQRADGRDVRRRVRRVPALPRARPPAQAVDAARRARDRAQPPAAGLRRTARSRTSRADARRALGARARARPAAVEPLASRRSSSIFHGLMERARQRLEARRQSGPRRRPPAHRARRRAASTSSRPTRSSRSCAHAEDEQDAALFLTAAFTGLRQGELIALRWRDVDFPGEHIRVTASYTTGALTSPKSGRVRSVPMAPAVAEALARLAQREHWTGDDDLVFPGVAGTYLDARRCSSATSARWPPPACGRCASTTCATRSARR